VRAYHHELLGQVGAGDDAEDVRAAAEGLLVGSRPGGRLVGADGPLREVAEEVANLAELGGPLPKEADWPPLQQTSKESADGNPP